MAAGVRREKKKTKRAARARARGGVGEGTCGEHSTKGDDEVNGIGDTVEVDEGHHDLHDHVDRETDNNLFSGKNTHHPPSRRLVSAPGRTTTRKAT